MGSLMASCLLEAGVELTVYDRRRAAAEPLLSKGARWADTAAAAASGCGMVWVSLPGPAEVEAVLLEYGAPVIAALPAGAILVDTTTNDPEVSRRVAAAGEQRGVAVLDAPVSGRPPTMTLMAGGDRADFHRARPVAGGGGGAGVLCGAVGRGRRGQAGDPVYGVHQPDCRH